MCSLALDRHAMSEPKVAEAQDASKQEMGQEKPSTDAEAQQTDSDDAQDIDSSNARKRRNISAFASLGLLDRFLAVWIFLAMAVGIILGNFVPSMSPALEKGTFVGVSVPIGKLIKTDRFHESLNNSFLAIGLLVMMYPILCKVQYESLHKLLTKKELWKQIGFSVVVNWIIAPFLMVGF